MRADNKICIHSSAACINAFGPIQKSETPEKGKQNSEKNRNRQAFKCKSKNYVRMIEVR